MDLIHVVIIFVSVQFCQGENVVTKAVSIDKLSTLMHSVDGCVCAVDERTICVKSFSYDGAAPDAYFWAGSTTKPDLTGFIIPNEAGGTEPLKGYKKKNLTLKLPVDKSLTSLRWISVYCRQFAVNFGHVMIPENIKEKLNAAKGSSCHTCSCKDQPTVSQTTAEDSNNYDDLFSRFK